ncbi:DUF2130 domain-containing protein [Thermoproteota archaeon]
MNYVCPLCGQKVTLSTYNKITGIWKEKQKLLKNVKKQREKLEQRLKKEKDKIRKQSAKFKKEKNQLIRKAVDKKAKQLETKIESLKRKEKLIQKKADDRVNKAIAHANLKANRQTKDRLKSLKKQLEVSLKKQLKQEREKATQQVKNKYERLNRSFKSTLTQMRTKNTQLRKQEKQIKQLEVQLRNQTTPQIEGLLYESTLIKELKKRFPNDKFEHTGKGGDIIHNVINEKSQVGIIVYECKKVQHYSQSHLKQTFRAKEKRKADFAILVTNAMKKGTQGFFIEKGVVVIYPAGVLSLVSVLRNQLLQIAEMKLSKLQKDNAMKLILEYVEGPEFSNSIESIIRENVELYNNLIDEIKKHVLSWKKRWGSYQKVCGEALTMKNTSKTLLSGEKNDTKKVEGNILPSILCLPDPQELKTLENQESS